MLHFIPIDIPHLLHLYGYWMVAAVVALEGMGLPLPGETTLVAASIYAGETGQLGIGPVVLAAFLGAVAGDNTGFWIGRFIGHRLVAGWGRHIGVTERRLKIGQYLFWRHGGKVVFFARFVAILRSLAALLAGINGMPWRRFAAFNAGGCALWSMVYGFGAYAAGNELHHLSGPIAIATSLAVVAAFAVGFVLLHRHGRRLADEAERWHPGPLGRLP